MKWAVLGAITFQALSSPESMELSRAWHYAEHPTVESSPKLQWIGNELGELPLEILLHSQINNPKADLDSLIAAADAHQAMALVMGNGDHRGWWVITKITESAILHADDGSIIAAKIKLELKQWARDIEIDPEAPPQPDNDPPGMIVGELQPGQSVAGVVGRDGVVTFPAPKAGISSVLKNATSSAPPAGANPALVSPDTILRRDSAAGTVLA